MSEIFAKWCALNGCNPVPVPPHMVARFVADIAPFGMDTVWSEVQAISRAHYTIGLADPTLGHPVATAINSIANIQPPRSWPKDQKAEFLRLPYDLQLYVCAREKQRDRAVSDAKNEAAKLRNEKLEAA